MCLICIHTAQEIPQMCGFSSLLLHLYIHTPEPQGTREAETRKVLEPSEPPLFVYFLDKITRSPGYPQINYVAKDDLDFMIFLSLPPKAWYHRPELSP